MIWYVVLYLLYTFYPISHWLINFYLPLVCKLYNVLNYSKYGRSILACSSTKCTSSVCVKATVLTHTHTLTCLTFTVSFLFNCQQFSTFRTRPFFLFEHPPTHIHKQSIKWLLLGAEMYFYMEYFAYYVERLKIMFTEVLLSLWSLHTQTTHIPIPSFWVESTSITLCFHYPKKVFSIYLRILFSCIEMPFRLLEEPGRDLSRDTLGFNLMERVHHTTFPLWRPDPLCFSFLIEINVNLFSFFDGSRRNVYYVCGWMSRRACTHTHTHTLEFLAIYFFLLITAFSVLL